MRYRRLYVPGGTYFFTVVTFQRKPIFSDPNAVELLRQSIARTIARYPFAILASVILLNHLHMIWTLPEDDHKFSLRWRLLKSDFTRQWGKANHPLPVWQNRFWEHCITDGDDFENHMNYIHYNPVKHGLVASPAEWPYSSFHKYVREGYYFADWGTENEVWDGKKMME